MPRTSLPLAEILPLPPKTKLVEPHPFVVLVSRCVLTNMCPKTMMCIRGPQSSYQTLFQEGGGSTEHPSSQTLFPKLVVVRLPIEASKAYLPLPLSTHNMLQLGVYLMDESVLQSDLLPDGLHLVKRIFSYTHRKDVLKSYNLLSLNQFHSYHSEHAHCSISVLCSRHPRTEMWEI